MSPLQRSGGFQPPTAGTATFSRRPPRRQKSRLPLGVGVFLPPLLRVVSEQLPTGRRTSEIHLEKKGVVSGAAVLRRLTLRGSVKEEGDRNVPPPAERRLSAAVPRDDRKVVSHWEWGFSYPHSSGLSLRSSPPAGGPAKSTWEKRGDSGASGSPMSDLAREREGRGGTGMSPLQRSGDFQSPTPEATEKSPPIGSGGFPTPTPPGCL